MKRPPHYVSRLSAPAPWLALLVLMGFSQGLPIRVQLDEQAIAHRAAVAEAMESVPYFLGQWIGKDEIVPPEAQKLLRPNAIFSRTYQKNSQRIHILLVHCSDARDMIGHYPPICYPSAGWVESRQSGSQDVSLDLGKQAIPVRSYRFDRLRDDGGADKIRIFNAFILPDGTVTSEISDINRLSERRVVSARGVAQLQVISPASMDGEQVVVEASELMASMGDLFRTLQVIQGATQ